MKRKIFTIKNYSVYQDGLYYGISKQGETPPHCGYLYISALLNIKGLDEKDLVKANVKKESPLALGEMVRHFFECEKGNKWSECEREDEKGFWQGKLISKDNSNCFFSGCLEYDHKIKLVESLDGYSEECEEFQKDWFHSIYSNGKNEEERLKNGITNLSRDYKDKRLG